MKITSPLVGFRPRVNLDSLNVNVNFLYVFAKYIIVNTYINKLGAAGIKIWLGPLKWEKYFTQEILNTSQNPTTMYFYK